MNRKAFKIMLKGKLLRQKNFSLNDSIFIISSPRGGSTWLGEIFSAIPNTIINWEPFHPVHGVLPKDFNGGDAIFIPEEETSKEMEISIMDILNFKKYTNFTLSFSSLKKVVKSKIVITKSVRTTCLIPWIVKHVPLVRKPVYLLRHPVAISFSHLKAFDNMELPMQKYVVPEMINNERFIIHKAYLKSLNSKIERQVAFWCLNNIEVINHPDHGKKWIVAFYENLVLDPENETKKIFDALNLSIDPDFIKKINFQKPSQTDMKQDFIKNGMKQLEKWKGWLSKEEKEKIQDIFDYFGLELYSAFEVLPKVH